MSYEVQSNYSNFSPQTSHLMKKIIVPTDFSSGAANALNFAKNLARKNISEILLLHCVEPIYSDPTLMGNSFNLIEQNNIEELTKTLASLAREVQESGVITKSLVKLTDIATAINEIELEELADFVIIGKTGKTGFIEQFWGNTSSSILNNIKLPLCVVPEKHLQTEVYQIIYAT